MSCPRLFKKLFQDDGASRMLRPDIIPASQDITVSSITLNQFTTAGEYIVTGPKTTSSGYPEDTTDDIYLKVITTGNVSTQYYLHDGTLLGRYKDASGTWSDWKEVGTNYDSQIEELDAKIDENVVSIVEHSTQISTNTTNIATNTANISEAFERIDDVSNWETTAVMHNNIYRGANLLGDGHFSNIAAVMTALRAGNFDDIYVGDYIPATYTVDGSSQTTNFRIAGINTLNARRGEEWGTTDPNLCIVPDTLGAAQMNSTNTTEGGYVGSEMYTTVLPKYYTAIAGKSGTPFYGYLRTTMERLSKDISTTITSRGYSGWTGAVNSVANYASQNLTLMSNSEVFGHGGWSSSQWDEETIATQLPMFQLNPKSITLNGTLTFWLRSVATSTHFCYSDGGLYTGCTGASGTNGVRPRFFIA